MDVQLNQGMCFDFGQDPQCHCMSQHFTSRIEKHNSPGSVPSAEAALDSSPSSSELPFSEAGRLR